MSWRKLLRLFVIVVAAITLSYHALILFRITKLRHSNPSTTNLIEQRVASAKERGREPKTTLTWVPYQNISPHLVRAVLAGEDIRFSRHAGIDWQAVGLAMKKNWREKRISRGGSSITQQLAKNLFLSPFRNPARKLHEMLIAWEMEVILGKRRILEIYLNVIEWGDGIYGAEAAARHYFGVSAASLNEEQAIFLSAIIPAPLNGYNPNDRSYYLRHRVNVIRSFMKNPLSRAAPQF
ncbi:MAG: monofunctional biosynthetic peptidoglycan transglycosylase [Chloracidobacterium sp.]|nr:monofunctional biosynthetic peptidoglycan transglycosylase [Chloracidobacterium sp.]